MRYSPMFTITLTALVVGACSTTPPTSADVARDMAEAQKIRNHAVDEQRERDQARMEHEASQVPQWALQAPSPDEGGVYAIGMGGSDNLRLSIRKAFLDGEYGLARATNQLVSGSERSYSKDANSHAEHEEYTGLIDSLVSSVPVVGVETLKQETKPVNGVYSTYVLLKLPYKELNRALQSREAKSQDQTVKEAFAELYARLDAAERKAAKEAAAPALGQTVQVVPQHAPVNKSEFQDPTKVLQAIVPSTTPQFGVNLQSTTPP